MLSSSFSLSHHFDPSLSPSICHNTTVLPLSIVFTFTHRHKICDGIMSRPTTKKATGPMESLTQRKNLQQQMVSAAWGKTIGTPTGVLLCISREFDAGTFRDRPHLAVPRNLALYECGYGHAVGTQILMDSPSEDYNTRLAC